MRYPSLRFALLACACAAATVPTIALGQEAKPARTLDIQQAHCPRAEYPRPALRHDVTGRTLVALTVLPTGEVADVQVVGKSGDTAMHALLDAEAVRVTAACRFPEAADTAPTRARLPYQWKISD